jgi:hypothetical protein
MGGCGESPHKFPSKQLGGATSTSGSSEQGSKAVRSGRSGSKRGKGTAGARSGKTARKLSPRRRRDVAARVSGAVLGQMALPVASIAVTRAADSVTIAIAKNGACTATRADAPRIALVVRKLIRYVKTVGVTVAGTGQSLSSYVAAHCKERALPKGSGRAVFDRHGAGFVTTPAIKIRARHWTIAYSSQASFLRISVYPGGGKRALGTVAARGRRTGQKRFEGPGTFILKIGSPATWTIQVRDGS